MSAPTDDPQRIRKECDAFEKMVEKLYYSRVNPQTNKREIRSTIKLHDKKFCVVIRFSSFIKEMDCMLCDYNLTLSESDVSDVCYYSKSVRFENIDDDLNKLGCFAMMFKSKIKDLNYCPLSCEVFNKDKDYEMRTLFKEYLGDLCFKENEPCSVCLQDNCERETACGHKLCYDCHYKLLQNSQKCPVCRRKCLTYRFSSRDLRDDDEEEEEEEE